MVYLQEYALPYTFGQSDQKIQESILIAFIGTNFEPFFYI